MLKAILVRIERRDGPDAPKRWEEFSVPYTKNANVISVLMEIQRNPVTTAGKRVPPPVWDQACLEEVCGSCTMNVNGKVRQACSALIDRLEQPGTLQPMEKFPPLRGPSGDWPTKFAAPHRGHARVPTARPH